MTWLDLSSVPPRREDAARETINVGFLRSVAAFAEVKNVFDRRYVASANNITNTLTAGVQNPGFILAQFGTGSVFAGQPRAFAGGVKVKF